MLKNKILGLMHEIAMSSGFELIEPLEDATVLLECGLDSLGFAILVLRLEEDLGFDPFVLMDEPVYPRTIKDFVGLYERFQPRHP